MTRVIAGNRKGHRLEAPRGTQIRPTTDRVKEWIFSVLQDVREIRVLDLFCGTGSLGIEALSRGAGHCTFVDNARRSAELTRENLRRLEFPESITDVLQLDCLRYLDSTGTYFELILADPPYYNYDERAALLQSALARLTDRGTLVLESGDRWDVEVPDGFELLRDKSFGRTHVMIYGRIL